VAEDETVRTYVVQDSEGRIIGAVPSGVQEVRTTLPGVPVAKGDAEDQSLQVRVVPQPLPGQTIYEVELPSELERLDPDELIDALTDYEVLAQEGKLVRLEA
jgi:hypothetical protein